MHTAKRPRQSGGATGRDGPQAGIATLTRVHMQKAPDDAGAFGCQHTGRSVLGDYGASQPVEPIVRPEQHLIDIVADVGVFQGGEERGAASENQSRASADGESASIEVDVIVFNADAEVRRKAVLKTPTDYPSVCGGGGRNSISRGRPQDREKAVYIDVSTGIAAFDIGQKALPRIADLTGGGVNIPEFGIVQQPVTGSSRRDRVDRLAQLV